jgi:plasmid maintenance system antidote protein VapI
VFQKSPDSKGLAALAVGKLGVITCATNIHTYWKNMPLPEKERLNFILDRLGLGPRAFADKLQIPVDKIKSIKYGKVKISADIAILIEQIFGFDFKWIITGLGSPNSTKDAKKNPKTSNVYEFQHMELIRRFKNKKLALDITHNLIALENLDPESFKRIESYLKGTLDTIRDVSERKSQHRPDRRKKERRLEGKSKKVPKHLDRRNNKDRRQLSWVQEVAKIME